MKRPYVKLTALAVVVSLLVLFCVNCFAEIPIYTSSDGLWRYSLINGDEAFICSGDNENSAYLGEDKDIIIPAYIDGHKVFGISKYAFAGVDGISSISVPQGIVHNGIDYAQSTPDMSGYFCYKGTSADTFAKQNEFLSSKIRYFGDVNSDAKIDLSDYALIKNYLDGSSNELEVDQLRAADYDVDTSVDAFDLFYINRIANSGMHIGNGDDDSHYAIIEWG
jgi:hypothetical protein